MKYMKDSENKIPIKAIKIRVVLERKEWLTRKIKEEKYMKEYNEYNIWSNKSRRKNSWKNIRNII